MSQYFPSSAAPIGSISSMEVNVDLLDQMELIDISDQETLDVFFSSGGEDGGLTSPLPGIKAGTTAEITRHTTLHIPNKMSSLTLSPGTQQQRGSHQ